MKTKVVPAILAKSLGEFKDKLAFLSSQGFKVVQIDAMDGKFVKNKTFFDLTKIKTLRTNVEYELHLMVEKPEPIIKKWLSYSKAKRFIIHYEVFHKRKIEIYDIIQEIKAAKKEVGIAINPNTTISKVLEFLPNIDQVLIMGVQPGFSGQKFQDKVLVKISDIRKHYPKLDIAVDGGVSEVTYPKIIKAGANILDVASLVFAYEHDPKGLQKALKEIKKV